MEKKEIEENWHILRNNYSMRTSSYEIVRLQRENLGNQGPVVSNITPMVPIFLMIPPSHHGPVSEEALQKAFHTRLRGKGEWKRWMGKPMNVRRLNDAVTDVYAFEKLLYTYSTRLRTGEAFEIGKTFCVSIPGVLSEREVSFVWAVVVPQGESVEFHSRYLNMKPIYPPNFGMEFWYCPENAVGSRNIKAFMMNSLPDYMAKHGLSGHRKSVEEMAQLFTTVADIDVAETKFTTLMKKKVAGRKIVDKALKGIYPAAFSIT